MKEAAAEMEGRPAGLGSIRRDAPRGGMIIGIHCTREVFVNGVELLHEHSLRLVNHSPTGYAWGYGGSGPAQLALAILLKFVSEEVALSLHQIFKREVIAQMNGDKSFALPAKRVRAWLGSKGVRS